MTGALPQIARLGIGKVLDELRAEFPSLTISKIRYLEDEGLLQPERTPSGYRKFSFDDVERLRFILRQQLAPYFWPLSHIRQVLDDMERGVVPQVPTGPVTRVPDLVLDEAGQPTSETFLAPRSRLRLTREQLLESSGLDEESLTAVEEFGLITRRPSQTYYDGDDLQVAALAAGFADLGLHPRHLKHFATSADRQAGLVDQVVSPRARQADSDDAREAAAQLAALSVRLQTALVRNRLRS